MSLFDSFPFGRPAQPSAIVQEHEAKSFLEAKDAVLDRLELATTDHTGKRLNERRWRWLRDMVESL